MRKIMLISFFALLLVGCAGTATHVQAPYHPKPDIKLSYTVAPKVEISEEALDILRQQLDIQLKASKLLASNPENSARVIEI